jgi:putative methylase
MPIIPKASYEIVTPEVISLSSKQAELYTKIIVFVDKIDSFRSPKIHLEQYSLPSDLIALILILTSDDLIGQNVVDLGCGTGRLTLPIKKFFSDRVLGVDIDSDATNHLIQSQKQNLLSLDLLVASVEFLETFNWGKKYQTTFMNPPFGTKRRKLDLVFLNQALKYSQTIISVHKSNPETQKIITQLGKQYEKKVEILATVNFPQFPSFQFHRKYKHYVCVDLVRIAP